MTRLADPTLAIQEYNKLKTELQIREGLPHLFGFKLYGWQKQFIESHNRDCFILSSNQSGKSLCQIIKCIRWATEKELWPDLWVSTPRTFWYLYPSIKLATQEFDQKWLKELMPRNGFENDPRYGWKAFYRQNQIHKIEFSSGVTLYFMSYSQDAQDLQAATVHAIFLDEELPEELFPELQVRLRGTRGYFNMVFTATLGQDFWRRVMESERGSKQEELPSAFKIVATLYDCQRYADGTPSRWTDARINEEIRRCGTQLEVDRRIFSRFVCEDGLKFASFDRNKNVITSYQRESSWNVFSAVDVGGGGAKSHPAAIVFIAISPKYNKGVVFKCWRGDGVETTAMDILNKYRELKGEMNVVAQFFDYASKDFGIIASRQGEPFIPASKDQEIGTNMVNSLFTNHMLDILDEGIENRKLINELMSVRNVRARNKNDLVDATRYCIAGMPWDFSLKDGENVAKGSLLNPRDELMRRKSLKLSEEADDAVKELIGYDTEFNDYYEV